MSFRIQPNETVQSGLHRIAHEQIDKAIMEIDSSSLDVHKKVHQVRKRCKKLRGLIRLTRTHFEETYKVENQCFRDAARKLSAFRDAKTIIVTHDDVMERFDDQINRSAFDSIRRELTKQLNAIDESAIAKTLASVKQTFLSAKSRVNQWEVAEEGFKAMAGGLCKTRERAVAQLADAREEPDTDTLHQWRKRVKYHGIHLRLLRSGWSAVLKTLIDQTDQLGNLLGEDHDLAVFVQTLEQNHTEFGDDSDVAAIKGLIHQRRSELQQGAILLGTRLFAESTDCFSDRMRVYWRSKAR